jgi:hypothetical protein
MPGRNRSFPIPARRHSNRGIGVEVISPAIILITYFVVFRGSARQLPPPAAFAANPPSWRPTLPKKRTDAAVSTDAAVRDDGAVRPTVEHASH